MGSRAVRAARLVLDHQLGRGRLRRLLRLGPAPYVRRAGRGILQDAGLGRGAPLEPKLRKGVRYH